MLFKRFKPTEKLTPYIQEYWIFENADPAIQRQKIIPDGFCEIIFHYQAPYRINLHGNWETQTKHLFAGQISRHFFLENTDVTGMIGIKLKPAAPFQLFGKEQTQFTDKVVDLAVIAGTLDNEWSELTEPGLDFKKRVRLAEQWLLSRLKPET